MAAEIYRLVPSGDLLIAADGHYCVPSLAEAREAARGDGGEAHDAQRALEQPHDVACGRLRRRPPAAAGSGRSAGE